MKTRKLRLLSFVLAVAMMFAVAPVSAFADGSNNTPISGIVVGANGHVDGLASGAQKGTEADHIWDATDGKWSIIQSGNNQVFCINRNKNAVFDSSSVSEGGAIQGYVWNHGTIAGGDFSGATVSNFGTITGGSFDYVYNGSNAQSVENAIMNRYDAAPNWSNFKNSIVLESVGENIHNIQSGILPEKSDHIAENSKSYTIEASGFTLKSTYNNLDFSMKDSMCVVGEDETPAMTITVVPSSSERKVMNLKIDGLAKDSYDDTDPENVTLRIPAGNTEDIKITAVMEKLDLQASGNLPTKSKNADGSYGGTYDGWSYKESVSAKGELQRDLTIYSDYIADISDEEVDWTVQNNGIIAGGKYTGEVKNYGEITGGTYTGAFANCDPTEAYNSNATGEGKVTSGVFTPKADFGNQTDELNLTWLNVKNGTINNVDKFSMASVVGEQEVTVKPNFSKDLFRGWTYSGNISNAVAEQLEKQKNNYEMTLTLDGDAEDSINLMPMIDGEPFSITMLDGKASVGNDAVTAVVPGQTVTLSIDDSEIPAGMSFDHWVVNPADVELEGGFDATSRTTSFTMPAEELTIYASLRTDSGDDGTDAMTVVAGVAVGAGVAALTYHIGTELYAEQVLGKGVAIPRTREEVALKAWELAGKPAVELNGEPLSEAAQAEKWAVESGLMQNVDGSFNGSKKMSKLKALRTLDAAKKLG